MRVGSLFAGIGGFDLAARWMGWETAWFSEIDRYASAVLAKHWPGVPNHGDITKIDFRAVEPVDLLYGGFPCQDISNAGKRAGIEGARSGLWSEYARAIGELRPRYVVVENVAALLGRGLGRVLGDLAALGYDAEWGMLSACAVGAPHLRDRLYLLAYPQGDPRRPHSQGVGGGQRTSPTEVRGGQVWQQLGAALSDGSPTGRAAGGGRNHWTTEPGLDRMAYGVPHRLDRHRGLGNAIVPQCALVIFQAIQAREAVIRAA